MTKYGLIGVGPVGRYLIAKLPNLHQDLGPVAASTHRAASRIVNTLRAGVACRLKDLDNTRTILICAPGDHLNLILPLLEKTPVDWNRKSLVLADSGAFSRNLEFFRSRGASVASLRPFAGSSDRYVLEGDRAALRTARHLVRQLRGTALEIHAEHYALYCAALTFSGSLLTPLVDACTSALRRAGVTGAHPTQVMEALFLSTLRTFIYSGRKSWSGTLAVGSVASIQHEIDALTQSQPALGEFYCTSAEATLRFFRRKRPVNFPLEKV